MRNGILVAGAAGLLACVLCSSAKADPTITAISGKMTHVAGDLAKTVTGEPVQTRQKEIVKDLDELIASLEKQCQNCRNGMVRNNPTRPATETRPFARAPAASATWSIPRTATRTGRRSLRESETGSSSRCPRDSLPNTAWSSNATIEGWPRKRQSQPEPSRSEAKADSTQDKRQVSARSATDV